MKKPNLSLNKKCCIAILFSPIALFALILYISSINQLLNEYIENIKDFYSDPMLCLIEGSNLDPVIYSFYSSQGSNTPNIVDLTSDINTTVTDLVPDTTVPDNIIKHEQYIKNRTGFSGDNTMGYYRAKKDNCIGEVHELKYYWNQGNDLEKKKLQIALIETGIWDIIKNTTHSTSSYCDLSSRSIASLSMTHYDSNNIPVGGLNGIDLDLDNNVYTGKKGFVRPAHFSGTKSWLLHHLETNLNDKRVELAALENTKTDKARIAADAVRLAASSPESITKSRVIKDALSINRIINK